MIQVLSIMSARSTSCLLMENIRFFPRHDGCTTQRPISATFAGSRPAASASWLCTNGWRNRPATATRCSSSKLPTKRIHSKSKKWSLTSCLMGGHQSLWVAFDSTNSNKPSSSSLSLSSRYRTLITPFHYAFQMQIEMHWLSSTVPAAVAASSR